MSKGIITLCGSTRFYADFKEANLRLTLADWIVLSIGVDTRSDKDIPELNNEETAKAMKERLDRLHKEKIDMSKAIMVIDINGYVGESTRSEIIHAVKSGKVIYSYEKTKFRNSFDKPVAVNFCRFCLQHIFGVGNEMASTKDGSVCHRSCLETFKPCESKSPQSLEFE